MHEIHETLKTAAKNHPRPCVIWGADIQTMPNGEKGVDGNLILGREEDLTADPLDIIRLLAFLKYSFAWFVAKEAKLRGITEQEVHNKIAELVNEKMIRINFKKNED